MAFTWLQNSLNKAGLEGKKHRMCPGFLPRSGPLRAAVIISDCCLCIKQSVPVFDSSLYLLLVMLLHWIDGALSVFQHQFISSLLQIDYTGVSSDSPCYNCAKNFTWNTTEPCVCTVNFTLLQPFEVSSDPPPASRHWKLMNNACIYLQDGECCLCNPNNNCPLRSILSTNKKHSRFV